MPGRARGASAPFTPTLHTTNCVELTGVGARLEGQAAVEAAQSCDLGGRGKL